MEFINKCNAIFDEADLVTCRDIYGCKNCPIKGECDEADEFCEKRFDSGAFDHELLMKIYTKGREDAINDCNKSK